MTKELIEILSSIGVSGMVVVVMFYFWIKKAITKDIVEPFVTPLKLEMDEVKKEIDSFKMELNKKDDKFERIDEMLRKNTETLQEIKAVFDLIKGKIEINFKEK